MNIEKKQGEASSQTDDVGHVRQCQETVNMLQDWSLSPLGPTAKRILVTSGKQAGDEPLAATNHTTSVVGNGSDAQTLQVLSGSQALPKKKKKKVKVAE